MGEGWGLGHPIRSHAALFHSPETPLRSLGSIVHALSSAELILSYIVIRMTVQRALQTVKSHKST
jgi:hypothetical protein